MLDEKDLQAIREMLGILEERVDEKLARQDKRIDEKLSAMEKRISEKTVILMEAEFGPKFRLLAEGQESILEKLVPRSRVDDLEEEVKFLKSIVRQMNEDLQTLKKAN